MPPFKLDDIPSELEQWSPAGATLAFPEQGSTSHLAFAHPANVVLKRCVDPLYVDWLRRERVVLEALEGTDLPVPRVLDYLDLGAEVWLVMTKLPGRQAAELLLESKPEARRDLLRVVGAAVRQLHNAPVPSSLRSHAHGAWVDRQLSKAQSNLDWCDGDTELLERLRATQPAPVLPNLIHGDLNLENVLVADGAVAGFVDWSGGDHGDPRCDVALALLSDEDAQVDEEMQEAFFSGYGASVDRDDRRWFEGLYEFF